MKPFDILAFSAIGLGTVIKAQYQSPPQNLTEVTIPWVDYSSDDLTDYFQYPATSLGSSGADTTYGLFCDLETTSLCFGLTGWTSMTLVTSPQTLEVVFNQASEYGTTGCTLTGTPFPTTGTCSETYTTRNGSSVSDSATTYTVPNASTDFVGYVLAMSIYTATLAVIEADVTGSSGTSSTLSSAVNTGMGNTDTSKTGASNTGASKTSLSRTSASNTGTSTGFSVESTQGSSSSSHNAAMITGAPSWMLLAGAVAGAAVGV